MALVGDLCDYHRMESLESITKKLVAFRDERDWKQFHKPKDLAISLALEVSEVLEHFQWKSEAEIQQHVKKNKSDIAEELADVFNWVLIMAHDLGIDILDASAKKILANGKKYPVAKARGKHTKYTKL